MSTANKINIFLATLVVCLLLSVGVLAKLAWDQHELEQANSKLNEQLMAANLEIGKAETRFGKAQDRINELDQEVQDWITRYNEQVDAYGELKARYDVVASGPMERIVYVTGTSIHIDTGGEELEPGVYLALWKDEITRFPMNTGYHDHRIDINVKVDSKEYGVIDGDINYQLHMSFAGELIKTSTQSGAINYYFNLWEVNPEGDKLGKLELETFVITTIDERAPQMFWWAPHLDISGFAALGKGLTPQWGAAIGISAMGYGLTENDLQFRFLNLSMDLGSSLGIGFTPVQYNLGTHIPLISNLWVGPHVGFNIDQEWYAGIVLGAML